MSDQLKGQQQNKQQEHKSHEQSNENTSALKFFTPVSGIQPFTDNRPSSIAQRKLQEKINNSPQVQNAIQLQSAIDNSPKMRAQRESIAQLFGKKSSFVIPAEENIQKKENNTGLPDQLKTGVENLSGMTMDDVKVHYSSSKPAALNALAYAQGNQIDLGPGQERHLPHEAWHVVQQRQGRVKPTLQMKGVAVNDDNALEKEADVMGEKAAKGEVIHEVPAENPSENNSGGIVQRFEAPGHEAAERVALTEGNKFSNDEASMVYFGNWMRDMNQALVPSLGNALGTDVVFSLVSFLGYKKFGRYMNAEQFGFYIPSEHIDNPAGQIAGSDYYASAPAIDPALTKDSADSFGTTDWAPRPDKAKTAQESLDPATATVLGANIYSVDQSGVLAYIRRTNLHVEKRLEYAASKGRTPEGMMHFGAAMHAVEDLFAHSNFVEIAVEKVLKDNPDPADKENYLVPELSGGERYVRKMTSTVNDRPVLTTGTFTGLDTMESIGAEGVKMLREGLGPVSGEMERNAQDKFVGELIRKADSKPIKAKIIATLDPVKDRALIFAIENTPLYDFYMTTHGIAKFLRINLQILDDLKNQIRKYLNDNVLSPMAGEVEARLLVAKVQETPLYKGEKENQQVIDSNGKKVSPMQEIGAKVTGKAPDYAKNLSDAQEKKKLLAATPQKIKAGPSHSQLAKDHKDSIFFGLAFRLVVEADKLLKDKMLAVWGTKTVANPDNEILKKDYTKLDNQDKEKYSFLQARTERENKSLKFGQDIYSKGHAPGQQYSLQHMRDESAENLIQISLALTNMVNAPKSTRGFLDTANKKVQKLSQISTETKGKINLGIGTVKKGTVVIDDATAANELRTFANEFEIAAQMVRTAKTLQEREAAYKSLILARDEYVDWVTRNMAANNSYTQAGLPAYLLFAASIDKEMATVAPAYPMEQVNMLADANQPLAQSNITLPSLTGISNPNVKDLLETSRMIINHPYENKWWEPHLKDFMKKNSAQMAEEIRARNAGYVKFDGGHH